MQHNEFRNLALRLEPSGFDLAWFTVLFQGDKMAKRQSLRTPRRVGGASVSSALLALLFVFLCMVGAAQAADVSASAAFSNATTTVFEPVELQITVTGATQNSPPDVRIDGLDIQFMGQSSESRIELNNFNVTSIRSVIYTYAVTPKRAGTFTVPALHINVGGGKTVSTQPATLAVVNGGQPAPSTQSAQNTQNPPPAQAQQAQPSQAAQDTPDNRSYFAEWVLPITQAYVGQSIPVEYRLYIDSRISWNPEHYPSFTTGDGFTVAPIANNYFAQPKPMITVNRGGRSYDMVVFKTAITPVKPGRLTLPSTDVTFVAQVQQRARRPQVPQGFPDLFDEFNQQFAVRREVTAHADAQDFDVDSLPLEGRPKSFSGAIGQFTLKTKASPVNIHAGDPITVTTEISGVGNFGQPAAPVIEEEAGWKAYPPSSKFNPDDEVGLSGVKTFETALIPSAPKQALPKIEFSYFDPSRKQYVTLTGDRIPISVEGFPSPSATPAMANATNPTAPAVSASPTPQPRPNDILFIRTDPGRWGIAFEPLWQMRHFWLAQLLPLGALLGFCGWQWRQARLGDLQARRMATLRAAKAEAARLLHEDSTNPGAFYDAAVRVLQLETAIGSMRRKSDRDPATLDAEAVCAGHSLDPDTAAEVCKLFAAHDELRYAGAGAQDGTITPERREHVLRILERFETNHG